MADEPKEPKPPQVPTGEKPASSTPAVSTPPAKPADAGTPAAPPKAAAPPPPKPPVVLQTPLDNDLVKRFRAKFGTALLEAIEDRKQAILTVERAKLVEISLYLRDEEKFDMLSSLTAVDWPKREKRFDVVLDLYSFPKNERLRSAQRRECLVRGELAGARSFRHVRNCFFRASGFEAHFAAGRVARLSPAQRLRHLAARHRLGSGKPWH